MRKIFIIISAFVVLFSFRAQAQLGVTISNVEVDSSQNATVDFTVSNFTNLVGITFSINYDSLVLEYNNTTNYNTTLGISSANFGPPNGNAVKKGQLIFSWDDTNLQPKTLPNGTRIFSVVLKAIGTKCSMSDINISNVPRKISIVDGNLNESTTINVTKGKVTIKCDGGNPNPNPCPNPQCSNSSNLAIYADSFTVKRNNQICIPVKLDNVVNAQSGQGNFTWNPTLLTFKSINIPQSGGLPPPISTNTGNAANGSIGFIWSNETPDMPVTLPNGSVMLEICFDVVGPVGQVACLLINQGAAPASEWTAEGPSGSIEVPTCVRFGKVKIIDDTNTPDKVTIRTVNNSGEQGSIICIDVLVDSLINGLGLKTEFKWNPAALRFVRTDMYNLEGLKSMDFNNTDSTLRVLWTSPNPVTKANGSKIFQICFELIGPCPSTNPITYMGTTDVTVLFENNPTAAPVMTMGSTVSISCGTGSDVVCTLGTITNPLCNGLTTGAINLTVTGTTADCNCLWKDSNGNIVKASGPVSAGCNLTNVGAGSYTYEVTCSGTVVCSGTATISQPSIINIPTANVVTNVGCGQNGSINLTNTSGGTPGTPAYNYMWNPNLGNTNNPSNLSTGSYAVTVTDANGCTATASFVVGDSSPPLTATISGTNVKCKGGNDGTISVAASGGCTPYTYTWTGGLSGANPTGVQAGSYTVTVSDNSSPSETVVLNITITEPAQNLTIGNPVIVGSPTTSNIGSITVTITGGTSPYTTAWAGGAITPGTTTGTITASMLAIGSYSLTVTDANGCTATLSPIVVPQTMGTGVVASIQSTTASTNFNGFGVSCFNGENGSISAVLSAGTLPITATLKRGSQTIQTQTMNALTVSFTNLKAGNYIIDFTNAAGTVSSTSITVTEPTRLVLTPAISCTEKNIETGAITINMNNTGVSPYTFNWSGSSEDENVLQDIGVGAYNVTVSDLNGCTASLTNIEVKECSISGACYTASTLITPNGDNFNNEFIINCVQDYPSDLTVFDRWGRVVYSQTNYDNTWQGLNASGVALKEGSYIWVLDINFGQGRREIQKGTVTILLD